MNELGGFRNEVGVGLVGLDIEAKAALIEEAFWAALPFSPEDYASITTRLVRTDKPDPATNARAYTEPIGFTCGNHSSPANRFPVAKNQSSENASCNCVTTGPVVRPIRSG